VSIQVQDADEARLAALGYTQELKRTWSSFQNFAISFTIISVISGCSSAFGQAWNQGGPLAIGIGWPVVLLLVLSVALSLAELASSFPTAGAIYWWSARLGGPAWGWFTGWFNMVGSVGALASTAYAAAGFGGALLGWYGVSLPGINFADTEFVLRDTFVLFTVLLAMTTIVNMLSSRLVGIFNSISVGWHLVGLVTMVAILVLVPSDHVSVSHLFVHRVNNSGFDGGATSGPFFWFYILPLGFLLTMWTISGYDASAHVSEETRDASVSVARGLWKSVFYSGIAGWVLLLAYSSVITDEKKANAVNGYIPDLMKAFLSPWAAKTIVAIVVVSLLFCSTSVMTSASRLVFAFERDGGVTSSGALTTLNSHRVPWKAVIFVAVSAFVLTLPALVGDSTGNPVAFYAVLSVTVIGLYIAYAIPIFLRWRQGDAYEIGPWTLGRWSRLLNPVAFCWTAICVVVFSLPFHPEGVPFSSKFSWSAVNYAPVTVVGVIAVAAILWVTGGRERFRSPAEDMSGLGASLETEIGPAPRFPEAP
jgi:amino acid transporter